MLEPATKTTEIVDESRDVADLYAELPDVKLDLGSLKQLSVKAHDARDIEILTKLYEHLNSITALIRNQEEEEIARAKEALSNLPQIAESAAQRGETKVSVLHFTSASFNVDESQLIEHPVEAFDFTDPINLKPHSAAALVYQKCLETGLNPRIDFWHSDSFECGYQVLIEWDIT